MRARINPRRFLIICAFFFLLSACGAPVHIPTAVPFAGGDIRMTTPEHEMAIGTGQTLQIQASIHSDIGSPSQITFLANGRSIGSGSLTSSDPVFTVSNLSWTPRTAGEYWLQAQAALPNGHSALSDPVRVCVFGNFATRFEVYDGFCQVPTRVPGSPANGSVSMNITITPDTLFFVPPNSGCASSLDFTAIALVDDPADQVAFVAIDATFEGLGPGLQALNWITTHSNNQKEFRRTIDISNVVTNYANTHTLPPETTISWHIDAFSRQGTYLQAQAGNIQFLSTQCVQRAIENSMPSATSCPPGTYLAPSSQQCVQIEILTPNPNSGNGNKCPAGQKWTCTGITHQTCSCQ